jgi:hypothetical protein
MEAGWKIRLFKDILAGDVIQEGVFINETKLLNRALGFAGNHKGGSLKNGGCHSCRL